MAGLVPALLVRLIALTLQGQFFLRQLADALVLFLTAIADRLKLPLLVCDLLLVDLIFLLEVCDHLEMLLPVSGNIPVQGLQLGQGGLRCRFLPFQRGDLGVALGDLTAQLRQCLLKLGLALGLAFRLSLEGRRGALKVSMRFFASWVSAWVLAPRCWIWASSP